MSKDHVPTQFENRNQELGVRERRRETEVAQHRRWKRTHHFRQFLEPFIVMGVIGAEFVEFDAQSLDLLGLFRVFLPDLVPFRELHGCSPSPPQ